MHPSLSYFRFFSKISLRTKIFLFLFFFLFAVLGVGTYTIVRIISNTETSNATAQAEAFAELSTRALAETYNLYFPSGRAKFNEVTLRILSLGSPTIESFQLIKVDGEILFDTKDITGERILSPREKKMVGEQILLAVQESEPRFFYQSNNPDRLSEIIYPYFGDWGAHPYSARYFVSYESVDILITRITQIAALTFIFALFLSLNLLNRLFKRFFLDPLMVIHEASAVISGGNLERQIVLPQKDELGELAQSINKMTQSLKQNIKELEKLDEVKSEFITIASHYLRTPITVIKWALESLTPGREKLTPEQELSVSYLENALRWLSDLSETLIRIVSLEAGSTPFFYTEFDLCKLIPSLVKGFSSLAEKTQVSVSVRCSKACESVYLDRESIYQLILILLDNAIKFSKKGGEIKIIAEVRSQEGRRILSVCVSDTGIGIKREEKERIFKMFHRATGIQRFEYAGVGLGLFTAKLICKAYGGKIYLKESEVGKGSTFCFEIPLGKKEEQPPRRD